MADILAFDVGSLSRHELHQLDSTHQLDLLIRDPF
jgi:hypothetical protein